MSGVVVPDHDQVDVVRREAGLRNRLRRRRHGQIGRPHARIDDMPLADAGALANPRVRGLDELLQFGVRHHPRGHVRRQRRNLHRPYEAPSRRWFGPVARYHSLESFLGVSSPKYSYARGVATRPLGVRSRKTI